MTKKENNVTCIFNLDYGFWIKDIELWTLIIDKKDLKDKEWIKNAFFMELIKNDISIFWSILTKIIISSVRNKSINKLVKFMVVKKNKYVKVELRTPVNFDINKQFITIAMLDNEFWIKPWSKNFTSENIAKYILDIYEKWDYEITEMFFKILTDWIPKSDLSNENTLITASENFAKMINFTIKE